MKKVAEEKTKLVVFFIIAGIAGFLFNNPFTTPIHEFGHVLFAMLSGGGGEIAAWDMALVTYNGVFGGWLADIGGAAFYAFFFIGLSWVAAKHGRYVMVGFFVGLIIFETLWFPGNSDYQSAMNSFPVLTWIFLVSNILFSPIAAGISVPVAIEFWKIPWKPLVKTKKNKRAIYI
jgi:hypothetical protein